MKILIHTKANLYEKGGVGGAETSLGLIAEKLAAKGHQVIYIARGRSKWPSLKKKNVNGVSVYLLSPISWPSGFSRRITEIKKKWIRKQYALLIDHTIKKENIQIVHTFNEFPATYDILQLREKYPHLKIVLRVAGLYWRGMCASSPEMKKKIQWVFNNVDLLAFISEGIQTLFVEHTQKLGMQIHNMKRQVLEIGADDQLFVQKWKKPERDKFVIMMVGRMCHPKRQDLLIDAIRLLDNRKLELHLFGDGPEKRGLVEKVEKYKLKDQVHFHGRVSQEKIADSLSMADLFCHASEYEGLCKSIIEAMRIGTPLLASDVMSINSYIENGFNGYLVENDMNLWAEKISDIVFGENDLARISENEIEFAIQKYSPEKNIDRYIDSFQAIVNR